ASYSNGFTTRDALQQTSLTADLSQVESDFQRITADQRMVLNGMRGFGLELGDHTVRWTNHYIHDNIKQARLGLGQRNQTPTDLMQQHTAWFERQLINTQLVGEFRPGPGLRLDVRAGYDNSQRKAPFELTFEYFRTNSDADPYVKFFLN